MEIRVKKRLQTSNKLRLKSLKDEIYGFEIIQYGEADIKITLSLPQDLKDDETIGFSKIDRKELEHVGPFGDGTCDYKYSMSPKAIENIQARVLKAICNNEDTVIR